MTEAIFDREALLQTQAEAARTKREQELRDVAQVLAVPAGRRLLRRIMDLSHVFAPVFTGNASTYFNDGKRAVGLALFHDVMQSGPHSFLELMNTTENDHE